MCSRFLSYALTLACHKPVPQYETRMHYFQLQGLPGVLSSTTHQLSFCRRDGTKTTVCARVEYTSGYNARYEQAIMNKYE